MGEEIPLKQDLYYSEVLSRATNVTGIACGHFLSRTSVDIVVSHVSTLSVYTYMPDLKNFSPKYQCETWKEISTLSSSPQQSTNDAIFLLSVHGEWLLLQWLRNHFFPVAAGSINDALSPLLQHPQKRRFFISPSFGQSLYSVPISPDSPMWYQIELPSSPEDPIPNFYPPDVPNLPFNSSFFPTLHVPLFSFRAIIVVDDTIFVGVRYDGPPAYILEEFQLHPTTSLSVIPKLYGNHFRLDLKNGLEEVWKMNRPQPKQESDERNSENRIFWNNPVPVLESCESRTFVFFEAQYDPPLREPRPLPEQRDFSVPNLYSIINRVRHLDITHQLLRSMYPYHGDDAVMVPVPAIPGQDHLTEPSDLPTFNLFETNNTDCTAAMALCDTPASVAMLIGNQHLFMKQLKGASLFPIRQIDCRNGDIHKAVLSSTVAERTTQQRPSTFSGSESVKYQPTSFSFNVSPPSDNPTSSELSFFVQHVSALIDQNWRRKTPFQLTSSKKENPSWSSTSINDSSSQLKTHIAVFSCECIMVIFPTLQVLFFSFQSPLSDLPLFATFHRQYPPIPSHKNVIASNKRRDSLINESLIFGGGQSIYLVKEGIIHRQYLPHTWMITAQLTPSYRFIYPYDALSCILSRTPAPNVEPPPPTLHPIPSFLILPSRIGPQVVLSITHNRFMDKPFNPSQNDIPAHVINCCAPHRMEKPFTIVGKQDTLSKGVGVGNSGALYLSNVARKVIPLINSYRFDVAPSVFVARLSSSSPIHQLMLISVVDTQAAKKQNKPIVGSERSYNNIYRTLLYSLTPTSCDPLDTTTVGVATDEATVLFTEVESALVHVTSSKLVVIPTAQYVSSSTSSPARFGGSSQTFILKPIQPNYANSVTWTPPTACSLPMILRSMADSGKFKEVTFHPRFSHLLNSSTHLDETSGNMRFRSSIVCAGAARDLITVSVSTCVYVFVWRSVLPKSSSETKPAPAHALTLFQTLSFPSHVCLVKVNTLHNNTFLTVGCVDEGMVHLFRLDTVADSIQIENFLAEKRRFYSRQPMSAKIQRIPNGTEPLSIHSGNEEFIQPYSFIELQTGTKMFVKNVIHPSFRMTHFFSAKLRNEPSSCVLSLLNHSIKTCDLTDMDKTAVRQAVNLEQQDEGTSDSAQSSSLEGNTSSTQTRSEWVDREGEQAAVWMAGVKQGSVNWTILPLSIILYQVSHDSDSTDGHPIHPADRLTPPLHRIPRVSTYFVGQLPVTIAEETTRLLVYSDTVACWSWNVQRQMMLAIAVYHSSPFHQIHPIVLEEPKEGTPTPTASTVPTHTWVDTTDLVLVFGRIDNENSVATQTRLLSSCPIKIAPIPQLHAVAVLTREPFAFNQFAHVDTQQILRGLLKTEKSLEQNYSVNFLSSHHNDRYAQAREKWQKKQKQLISLGAQIEANHEITAHLPFRDLVLDYLREKGDDSITKFVKDFKLDRHQQTPPSKPIHVSRTKPGRMKLRDKLNNLPFMTSVDHFKRRMENPATLSHSVSYVLWTLAQHETGFHPRTPRCDLNGVPFADLASEFTRRQQTTRAVTDRPITSRPCHNAVPLGYSHQAANVKWRGSSKKERQQPKFAPASAKEFSQRFEPPSEPHRSKHLFVRNLERRQSLPPPNLQSAKLTKSDLTESNSINSEQMSSQPSQSTLTTPTSHSNSSGSVFVEDDNESILPLQEVKLYSYNLLIFDDLDVRNLLCTVVLTALDYSITPFMIDKETSTQESAEQEKRRGTHRPFPSEHSLENYTFSDLVCLTVPTSTALTEIREIEEKVHLHYNLHERILAKKKGYVTEDDDHESSPDISLDALHITPMGAGLTMDESVKKYNRLFLALVGREWLLDSQSQTNFSDIFLFELKRQDIVTMGERFALLQAQTTNDISSITNNINNFKFTDPQFYKHTIAAPSHNPATDKLKTIHAWPVGRLRLWGNVQGIFSERSFLVALNGPNLMLFNLSLPFHRTVEVNVESMMQSLYRSDTNLDMVFDLPESYQCSCCQPFFDENQMPRSVFPSHYSYIAIHSYSSLWLGLDEWRHQTRSSRHDVPVSTHLIATIEAPALITSFSMVSLLSQLVPTLHPDTLSYSVPEDPRKRTNEKDRDENLQATLSHLIHWSVFTTRRYRMVIVAAPCSVYVADLTLPHGFPTSLQLNPLFTKFCLLYSTATQSRFGYDVFRHTDHDLDSSLHENEELRSSNLRLHLNKKMFCTHNGHICSDPLPLNRASVTDLALFIPTHSPPPTLNLRVPSSEKLKVASTAGVTVKSLALMYLPSLVHAATFVSSSTVGVLCDKSTILLSIFRNLGVFEDSIVMPRHCARCGETFDCTYSSFPAQMITSARRDLPEPQRFIFHVSHGTSFEAQNMQTQLFRHFKDLGHEMDDLWPNYDDSLVQTVDKLEEHMRLHGFTPRLVRIPSQPGQSRKSQFCSQILRHFHRMQPNDMERFLPHRIRLMPHFSFQVFESLVPVLTLGIEGSSYLLNPINSDKIPMLDVMMEEYQDIVRNTTFAHIWRYPGWNLLKMFEDDEPLTFRNYAISGVPIKYLEGRSDDSETLLSFMLDAPRYIPLPSILSNGRVLSGELMNAMRANPLDTSRGLVFPTVNNMSHGANLNHHLAVSRDSFVFELWRSMRTRFQRIQSSHPHFSAVRVRRRVIREMMARFDQGKVSRVMSFLLIPFLSIYKTAADIPSIYHLSLHTETMDTDILGEQDDLEEGSDLYESSSEVFDSLGEVEDWAGGQAPSILGEPVSLSLQTGQPAPG